MERYSFQKIEAKWQKDFSSNSVRNDNSKKYYCLEMFPYPSGKIHMGHVRNYTIGDVIARYKFLNGFNVLHLWAGMLLVCQLKMLLNKTIYILKNGQKKHQSYEITITKLGLSIDWDLEISTCDKSYYKHQQEIFIDFYNNGLISRKETFVNWDPIEKTVLANEQVINGRGWRSNALVERKNYLSGFSILLNFLTNY